MKKNLILKLFLLVSVLIAGSAFAQDPKPFIVSECFQSGLDDGYILDFQVPVEKKGWFSDKSIRYSMPFTKMSDCQKMEKDLRNQKTGTPIQLCSCKPDHYLNALFLQEEWYYQLLSCIEVKADGTSDVLVDNFQVANTHDKTQDGANYNVCAAAIPKVLEKLKTQK